MALMRLEKRKENEEYVRALISRMRVAAVDAMMTTVEGKRTGKPLIQLSVARRDESRARTEVFKYLQLPQDPLTPDE